MTNHFCDAPICATDSLSDFIKDVVWYPGETVCNKSPMTKWQKNQRRINKYVVKGVFKHIDKSFTASSLEKIGKVTKSTKGFLER